MYCQWDSGDEKKHGDQIVSGNVNRLLVLPPDFNGQPVKGNLIFDAAFESGNLGRVEYVSECEYDLFIRPDTNSPKHRVWFYFSVKNVLADQRIVFNVVNFSKIRSLYRDGMGPIVRSSSRPQWQRIPSKHMRFEKSAAHGDQYVISFSFEFDREDDVYYFAYCFPYTYTKLQQHLISLEDMTCFRRELLATSEQGRRLDLVTITDQKNFLSTNDLQRVIVITARVHPGEPPASFLCQGIIDFLISENPIATILRRNFVFKIIPMLNPDGVFLGNGRCSATGYDLNRSWESPSVASQPTIYATKQLLMEYDQNPLIKVEFFFDLHSHSQQFNAFMYGNVFSDDQNRCERQAIFPTLLSEVADDFSLDLTQFNKDPQKAGTGRRVAATMQDGQSMCYTFEVSIYGYMRGRSLIPYSEESYIELGRKLAYCFYEFLEVEREARSVQTRPFDSFIRYPASVVNMDIRNPVSKHNSAPVCCAKNVLGAPDNAKMRKKAANYCVSRVASSPTTDVKADRNWTHGLAAPEN